MLEELRIASLGVIDEAVLELGPGLTVITGETGAGKTMVVTALGLLLGGRADSGAVRDGARTARVEGVVNLAGQQPDHETDHPAARARAHVEEAGGQVEEDRLLLARQVSAGGRSRAFTGGASVPVATLAALAAPLVAVHGQSDQHRLLQPVAQRDALDRFAGDPALSLRGECSALHARLHDLESQLATVVDSARERAREADMLRFGVDEVRAVAPEPGEDVELAAQEERLGFADELRNAADRARECLSADQGGPDALGATAAARSLLDGVREHDGDAAELADRLAEVSYLLSDVAADVSSYAARVETDPARLASVSERRAALTALTRKYGETVADVLAWMAASEQRLLELDNTDETVARLRGECDSVRAELGRTAAALSRVREEAAQRLGAAVTEELAVLAMPHARVSVVVRQEADPHGVGCEGRTLRCGPDGVDDVEILLSANQGGQPRPLGKGASGGELSRVMLAVEVALADTYPVPTFVFDEVDAGVGGRAAVEVGRRLGRLARHAQVLVVTHLPQVAAFADRHYVVAKSSDGTVTTAGLASVSDAERVQELSRMLAGMEASGTAMAHAEELLETAQRTRFPTR